jgi:hypothetical protein
VRANFFAPVQTGPGAQPASCTMGTGSVPRVNSGRGVKQTPHPFLVPWSRKGRSIPLLPLWAVRPVQSFSACTRVHFTFTLRRGLRLDVRLVSLCYNVSLCSQNRTDGVITGRCSFYYFVSTIVCKYQRRVLQCIFGQEQMLATFLRRRGETVTLGTFC